MKFLKRVSFLFAMLLSASAFSDAVIFSSGGLAKFLTPNGWGLSTGEQYRSLSADPSAGGGLAAPIGSLGVFNDSGVGELYIKFGSGDTDWLDVSSAADNAWSINGNAGTDPLTNFLGSSDGQDVVFKANSSEMMRLVSGGGITAGVDIDSSGFFTSDSGFNLRNSGQSVTLAPPLTLASGYSLTFPSALPSVTRPVVVNSSGGMSFSNSISIDTLFLPNNGPISWRNFADGAYLNLKVNTSDQLESDAPLILPGFPTTDLMAATKGYVDSVSTQVKPNIVAATTGAGTLATSFENGDTIDGVVLATGDRILIKDQAAPAQNGIYVVAASGAPTRATDSDSWDELVNSYIFVLNGTINKYSGYRSTIVAGGTLNTTAVPYALFSQAGNFTADGNGLELSGTQFALELDGTTLSKSATGVKVNESALANFTGDSGAGGVHGLVPAPSAGDTASHKVLGAGGGWVLQDTNAATITIDTFNGDNSTVAFTLSTTPTTKNNAEVYISGVYQQKANYSVSGTTLTFVTAPPTGTNNIEVQEISTVNLGTTTLDDASVTSAKLRNSAALSVIGRSANSSGVPGDIAASADGDVLFRNGTTLGFGKLGNSSITAGSLTTALANDSVTSANIVDGTITGDDLAPGAIVTSALPAVNYSVSSSSGSFTTVSTSYVDVTNLSVTLNTSNRPVMIQLMSGTTSDATSGYNSTSGSGWFKILANGVNAGVFVAGDKEQPCSGVTMFYPIIFGNHTYKIQAKASSGANTLNMTNCKLVVREL